jgi:ornithine cyclodeaminase/alanine dehydrogenase
MDATTFISDADLAATCAGWADLVAALREAYGGALDAQAIPPRSIARASGSWLRSLSAMPANSGYMGVKLIAASPPTGRVSYLIALFDRETTALVALIDGSRVTATRTAATSALAVELIAPGRPMRVAVIGSGVEARNHALAAGTVRAIDSLCVFSPTASSRESFAREIGAALGLDAVALSSAEEAVAGCDLVIAAARSRDESPTLRGGWLKPGATVVSIGSTLPEQHEVDIEVVSRAASIFADVPEEVAHGTGDMLDAAAAGVPFEEKLYSLHDLVQQRVRPRSAPEEIVLYKSVGSALQDIVVAELYLRRVRDRGGGTPLAATIIPLEK